MTSPPKSEILESRISTGDEGSLLVCKTAGSSFKDDLNDSTSGFSLPIWCSITFRPRLVFTNHRKNLVAGVLSLVCHIHMNRMSSWLEGHVENAGGS
jgi:hypothetical protein